MVTQDPHSFRMQNRLASQSYEERRRLAMPFKGVEEDHLTDFGSYCAMLIVAVIDKGSVTDLSDSSI